MMKKIITTVGTSIFTNYRDGKVKAHLGRDYASIDVPFDRTERKDGNDVPASGIYAEEFESHINSLTEIIRDFWYEYPDLGQPNKNASAEISSILKIAEAENEPCEVHLVATDTLQSVLAAELIVGWFERFPQPKVSKVLFQRQGTVFEKQKDCDFVVKDLRVRSQTDYEVGFMNLIELLERIYVKDNTILNITGGYKGIIPVLTLFGQLYELPLNYLYVEDEVSKQASPVVLGSLPVHFDLGYIENFILYLQQPERLTSSVVAEQMYNLGLLATKNLPTKLSIIGQLIKNKLESTELPFQRTTLGYLVEYKIYEYYSRNEVSGFSKPVLGYKISDEPGKDLEDADLWFENEDNVIVGEIKPAGFNPKNMRAKIRKILDALPQVTSKKINEFWVILYALEEGIDFQNWSEKVFNTELLQKYDSIRFHVKTIQIEKNVIDGHRNRINYQEFMRTPINTVQDVFNT
jgi:CRISPR/Cas system-associated protein Csm6